MSLGFSNFTCPWWLLFTFDNPLRKVVHNPHKILSPFIRLGDTALDVGCGMGYFTIEMARLVGQNGKVTAADLQPQMLSGLSRRIRIAGLEDRISPLVSTTIEIGISQPVDFALAFWMVHEVSDREKFLKEIYTFMKPQGKFLIVEPRIHVSKQNFYKTLLICQKIGFSAIQATNIFMSRTMLMIKNNRR